MNSNVHLFYTVCVHVQVSYINLCRAKRVQAGMNLGFCSGREGGRGDARGQNNNKNPQRGRKGGGGGTITEKFPGREGEGGIAASLYYVTLPRISLI